MNEYTMEKLKKLLILLLLCVSIGLVIVGQRTVGYRWLMCMLAGIAGIILILYWYNRKAKKGER
ncbi:MAG: DUF6903 family protein [Lachnospiraceae bacterium]